MDSFAIVAVALCFVAVIILAVPALADYLRHWRDNRHMHDAMQGKNTTSPKVSPRVEQLLTSKKSDDDALGWSDEGEGTPSVDSRKPSEVERGTVLGHEKTILIADDDPVVVHALARRLQHLGFQVLRSPNAVHALMGAMKTRPDLAILDINMPSGNGMAVCEMMASDPRCAGIPVIIHTVSGDEPTKERARRMGAHHVEKSAHSWNEIKTIVESVFGQTATSESQPATMEELSELPSQRREPTPAVPPSAQPVASRPTEENASSTAAESVPTHVETQSAPEGGPRAGLTVLCIDDDPVVTRSIAIRLQPYGIRLLAADNGTKGYLTAVKEQPDLILLDLKMPNGEGAYVLSMLKENDTTLHIPVIILTIETHQGIRRKMISTGAAAYLSKPVRWPELFDEMSHCVELPEQLLRDYRLEHNLTLSQL